jgi:VEFS-Box of polycomb protein
VYHYMYKDPETQLFHAKKEVIDSVECIWCGSFFGQYCKRSGKRIRDFPKKMEKKSEFNCNSTNNSTRKSIDHLMFHLRNCHFHFEYHPMRDQEGNLFIFMMRDRSQDLSVDSLIEEKAKPYYWFHIRHGKDRKSLLHQDLAIIKIPPASLQPRNKLKGKTETVSKETQLVATRQYYHPRTGLPIVDEELGYESEDECDNRWDLMMANQALDEFEDIGYEEKVFMKLWNTHIASFPPYGDGYLPIVCERFVRKFASRIVDEHLRYHCLFHFLVMHDFGLLRSDEVQYYMTIVDRQVRVKKEEDESINEL